MRSRAIEVPRAVKPIGAKKAVADVVLPQKKDAQIEEESPKKTDQRMRMGYSYLFFYKTEKNLFYSPIFKHLNDIFMSIGYLENSG